MKISMRQIRVDVWLYVGHTLDCPLWSASLL